MRKLIRSFYYAATGLRHCMAKERNFRIHLAIAVVVVFAGIGFHLSAAEWMVIVLCIGLVLALEMLNTALELLCDMVESHAHPVIKTIKDVSAGAVVLGVLAAVICGSIIFLPKLAALVF